MTMHNPKGRANYEPNSWGAKIGGPRESAATGFQSFPEQAEGPKVRMRSETFADHYSQARQFYISQTLIEQRHIADALVFELSKVEMPHIRNRVVSHLLNIDADLAQAVADDLGLSVLPEPATAAIPTRMDLPTSDALSILKNKPGTFEGRKLGVLLTDGFDVETLLSLQAAAKKEGTVVELIGPRIAGVEASDGSSAPVHHTIDGGPSVVFDAVVVLASEEGILSLLKLPAARDFVSDAYSHYKFIAFSEPALKLFEKVGLPDDLDGGFMALTKRADAKTFIETCRGLRYWDRPDGA